MVYKLDLETDSLGELSSSPVPSLAQFWHLYNGLRTELTPQGWNEVP